MVERFPIYFIPTEDSERIGLRGSLQLVIYSVTIGIARKGDKECFVLWPINVIRQYRLDSYQCGNTCSKANKSKAKDVSKANVSKSKDGPKTNRRSFYRSKSSSSSNSSKSSQSVNNNSGKRSTVVTIEVGRYVYQSVSKCIKVTFHSEGFRNIFFDLIWFFSVLVLSFFFSSFFSFHSYLLPFFFSFFFLFFFSFFLFLFSFPSFSSFLLSDYNSFRYAASLP